MSLGRKLISTGGVAEVCTTDTADKFDDSSDVALYTLDYDASDASGDNDGTPTDVTFGVSGQINYGARFNGTSSYISTSINAQNISTITYSFWAYWKSDIDGIVIGGTGNDGATGKKSNRQTTSLNGASNRFDYITRQGDFCRHTTSLSEGWHHFVVTDNNSTDPAIAVNMYVDGSSVTFSTPLLNQSYSTNTALQIGRSRKNDGTIGSFFNSDLDQVRIFNRVLSTDNNGVNEISALYAETACVYTATTTDNDFPTTNLAYYKLDNSAEDEKGSYDGTETDIEYRFGRFGQAAVFNGSSSFIDTNYTLTSDTSVSFSFWLNVNDYSSNDHYIFSDLSSSATDRRLGIRITSSGYFAIDVSSDGTNIDSSTYSSVISKNQWIHYVVVLDGTSYELYQDGASVHTDTLTQTLAAGGRSLIMGRAGDYNPATNYYYDGKIDQVRIFSTALTSDQVTELYNEKPEADTSNFKTILYEGTGSEQYISNVGFNLDVDNGGDGGLVWVKNRTTGSRDNILTDSVRGEALYVESNTTDAEQSGSSHIKNLEANGFIVGTNNTVNTNGDDYVGWVWRGGGDATSNTNGTNITSQVSVNAAAGFSIVKYTGTGVVSDTVGHGLSNAELIFLRSLDGTYNWRAWNQDFPANSWAYLDRSNTPVTSDDNGGIRNVDADTFGFINGAVDISAVNNSGDDYIAYVWKSITGYINIGEYTGTGTGTNTITTGFQPSWVMIRRYNSGNKWVVFDDKRDTTSTLSARLYLDQSSSEDSSSAANSITITSTGFSMDATQDGFQTNKINLDYIYMAIK